MHALLTGCRRWPRWAITVAGVAMLAGPLAVAQHAGHPHGGAGPVGAARAGGGRPAARPNQHFDGRYSHDQYYYNRGYSIARPPHGSRGEFRGPHGGRYWNHRGNWYRWNGRGWVVWGAPIGVLVPVLPLYFSTIWWYGVPYYYANDTYYVWDDTANQYQVVEPPQGIEQAATTQPPASSQLFIYPKNGQSADQQRQDQYDCHRWAVQQSGFDPTVAGGGVPPDQLTNKRNDYFRADASCLEGRGYTVE